MTVSSSAFAAVAGRVCDHVVESQATAVRKAADVLVASLRAGGVVHAFGTGHSQALAMEIAGRAGGLVPTNMISLRDVVIYGGEPPEVLFDHHLERDPQVGRRIYELAPVQAADVFVVASNSGVNGAVVEFASLVKERGHGLVAVTSRQHSEQVASRHPSGKHLYDFADVVLDNRAPYGDAVLPLPGGGAVCGISSITAALLAQMMIAEVISSLIDAGETPPVYLSANIPEGDAHNRVLEERYAGRIRRSA